MLVRLFQELFPFQPFARSTNIKITLFDSAMHGQTPSPLSSFFEMPLLKNANPVIAPWSKVGVRTHLHIPMDAKIAAFYSDSHERFIDALSEIPSPPEIVILSTKFTTLTSESRSFLSRQFPTYKVMTLTEFQAQHKPAESTEHYLLFNDTRHRMMEIYTASDYAVVIGSSNIFEPLQVLCPLIYFKNSVMGERYPTLQNNILGGYHAETWKLMGDIANQTRGAVGIIYFSDLPEAIHQIEKINPKDILHPAFVIPPGKNQSRFGDLLDQIEKLVREKLKIENTTEN